MRRLWMLLFVLPLVWAEPVYPAFATAQPTTDDSTEPPGDTGRGLEDEGKDLWDFDDEEEDVETWGALVRDQAPDLALFTLFATLTLVSFFRKSVWLKYVTFVAAIGYMGFAKSQLISVVNIYGAMTGNMPVFRYSLAWYLFAAFTVVSTVLWGRLYCGRVCAYGALTQLLDRFVPARLRVDVPAWLEQRAAWIKYGLQFLDYKGNIAATPEHRRHHPRQCYSPRIMLCILGIDENLKRPDAPRFIQNIIQCDVDSVIAFRPLKLIGTPRQFARTI